MLLNFNLKKNKEFYELKNVIGMNKESRIWEYLYHLYKQTILIILQVNTQNKTKQEMLDSPEKVNFEVVFFNDKVFQNFVFIQSNDMTLQ